MRFIDDLPYDSPGGTRFQLPPVTRESVLQTIKDFRSDCSTGVDQLPTRLIRISAEYLTVPSAIALRKRISQNYGRLLRCLQSQIKTDNPVSNDQPRPISVLHVLSKVFEKPAVSQMADYADSAHLPHNRISNFR